MNIKSALGLGVVLAAVVGTSSAHAQDTTATTTAGDGASSTTVTTTSTSRTPYGADVPITETSLPNRPLLVGSGTLLVASYVPTAVIGGVSDRSEDRYLFIPVAGPWVDLTQRDCTARPCTNEDLNKALIIGSGVLQGIGALGVLSSFFIPERTTRLSTATTTPQKQFAIAPAQLGRSAYGLSALGTF